MRLLCDGLVAHATVVAPTTLTLLRLSHEAYVCYIAHLGPVEASLVCKALYVQIGFFAQHSTKGE